MAGLSISVGVVFVLSFLGQGSSQSCQSCPDGWMTYNNNCYYFNMDTAYSWNGATHYCSSQSGELAAILSKAEDDFIRQQLLRMYTNSGDRSRAQFWLSGADDLVEGKWVWYPTVQDIGYTHWAADQPGNTHRHDEDCLAISGHYNFTWSDEDCTRLSYAICKTGFSSFNTIVG